MSELSNRPTKEQVRQWLMQRTRRCEPLPDIEQIQRTLGWKLAPNEYAVRTKSEQQADNAMLECLSEG